MQTLNADEAITVKVRSDTIADAQAALDRHEVFAILAIPKDTERQVLRGDKARIAAYVDAAYFLLYSRTLQGISEAAATVSADIATRGARSEGSLVYAALTRSASPIEFLSQPLFNPTGGYASYVVPAAFLLILQQTLLLGRRVARRRRLTRSAAARTAGFDRGRAPSSARRLRISASRCRDLRSI